jgi:hypothetical protein
MKRNKIFTTLKPIQVLNNIIKLDKITNKVYELQSQTIEKCFNDELRYWLSPKWYKKYLELYKKKDIKELKWLLDEHKIVLGIGHKDYSTDKYLSINNKVFMIISTIFDKNKICITSQREKLYDWEKK